MEQSTWSSLELRWQIGVRPQGLRWVHLQQGYLIRRSVEVPRHGFQQYLWSWGADRQQRNQTETRMNCESVEEIKCNRFGCSRRQWRIRCVYDFDISSLNESLEAVLPSVAYWRKPSLKRSSHLYDSERDFRTGTDRYSMPNQRLIVAIPNGTL